MLLKRCVIIIIFLFLEIIDLCDANEKAKENEVTDHNFNTTRPFHKKIRKLKKTSSKLFSKLTPNSTSNRRELKGYNGRFLDEYFVVTCRGHVLSIFRLTSEETSEKCPLLLVHGLFQSSDRFFEQDKEQSLALNLQDLGYDVWLANTRANKYNREHVFLEPETNNDDKTEFMNYNYELLGSRDIAEIVDFVLKVTTHEKLIYIGHSLGGTAFLVLNSLKPSYNSKFLTAFLFAPFGYQNHFPNKVLKAEAKRLDEFYTNWFNKRIYEIFPYADEDAKFSPEDCLGTKNHSYICDQLNIRKVMGLKSTNNNVEETRGGSLGPLIHLAQNVRSGKFARWDYGKKENLKLYGSATPPIYNLSRITVPTQIIYAPNDEFVSPKDIAKMASKMVNVKLREVTRKTFKHEDFIVGSDAMENVYAGIIDELKRNKYTCNGDDYGFLFYLEEYKWIWAAILLIILLAVIAICLMDWNKNAHKNGHKNGIIIK